MQTPSSSVNLACPQAIKAAISSWRTWTNWKRSGRRPSAPMMPRLPSPGYPKIRLTPHAESRCKRKSLTVYIASLTCFSYPQEISLWSRLRFAGVSFIFSIQTPYNKDLFTDLQSSQQTFYTHILTLDRLARLVEGSRRQAQISAR